MFCDLHIHSVYSDGSLTPAEIIADAKRLGLTVALTDHNTAVGLAEFMAEAERADVRAVAGVELSTDYNGTELHLLGLFIPQEHYKSIDELTDYYTALKEQSNIDLVRRLNEAGYAIDFADVQKRNLTGNVNRAHIATELFEKGYVSSVAEAFDKLESSGKVLNFGVSNHNPMQIQLLKTAVKQPLCVDQLQFSVTEAGMVTSGMNVNMKNPESIMHDGSMLEYARINKITIQAWSPFQHGFFKGSYIDNPEFPELNAKLSEIGEKYGLTKTGVATAWMLRHPANMQVIAGTMNCSRLTEICKGTDVILTRSEWYEIYRAAGHCLP